MDSREYDERRRSTFMWGGVAGRTDRHMVTSQQGGDINIKTGIPPKMKAEHTERWRAAREQAGLDRFLMEMFPTEPKPAPVERQLNGVWYKDGEIPH